MRAVAYFQGTVSDPWVCICGRDPCDGPDCGPAYEGQLLKDADGYFLAWTDFRFDDRQEALLKQAELYPAVADPHLVQVLDHNRKVAEEEERLERLDEEWRQQDERSRRRALIIGALVALAIALYFTGAEVFWWWPGLEGGCGE